MYSLRRETFMLLVVVSVYFGPYLKTWAVDLERLPQRVGLDEVVLEDMEWFEVLRELERKYNVRFSRESHPNAAEKETSIAVPANPDFPDEPPRTRMAWIVGKVVLTRQTPLREALQGFCRASDDWYSFTVIEGQVCLLPQDGSKTRLATLLDGRISFTANKLSTDDALRHLADAWNLRYPDAKLHYSTNADQGLARMAEVYYSGEDIAFEAEDTTLREVLCKILYESPLNLSYIWSGASNLIVCGDYKSSVEKQLKHPIAK